MGWIFDCCIIPFHPIFFSMYYCPWIVLGQVMTRLRLNMWGGTSRNGPCCARIRPFQAMLFLTILFKTVHLLYGGILRMISMLFTLANSGNRRLIEPTRIISSSTDDFLAQFSDPSTGSTGGTFGGTGSSSQNNGRMALQILSLFVGFTGWYFLVICVSILIVVTHTRTRNHIRRTYSIGTDMSCWGDCCCALCCSFCSTCQMARHTANYHTVHRSRCCTSTGLDEEWDEYDFNSSSSSSSLSVSGDHSSRITTPMMV
jgi:Cys-rich protein (TIGR01571 family)